MPETPRAECFCLTSIEGLVLLLWLNSRQHLLPQSPMKQSRWLLGGFGGGGITKPVDD